MADLSASGWTGLLCLSSHSNAIHPSLLTLVMCRQPQTLERPAAAEPIAPPSSSSPADLSFLQPTRCESGASSTSGRPLPRPFAPHSLPPRAWAHPSRQKHGLGDHTGWQRANVATYASAAAAQEVARASSASMPEPDRGGAVVPGALVEYQRDAQVGLALLLRADGKRNWLALNTRCAGQRKRGLQHLFGTLYYSRGDPSGALHQLSYRGATKPNGS